MTGPITVRRLFGVNVKEMKKYSLLAEVACDYYERGLSQNEIADRMCLSRSRVSRLLTEAKEAGIVQVVINYNFERHFELEDRIEQKFPVKRARVLNNRGIPKDKLRERVGRLAADYITENLKKDMVIGTAWGTTLAEVVQCITPAKVMVQVVQLMGAVPCRSANHTPQGIVSAIADTLQCKGEFLNLPLYIEDPYVRKAMCEDVNNRRILNQGMFSDMILTSVSDIESINKKETWLGYLSAELYEDACENGAVGAMFARFFDKDGNEVDCKWNKSCISISFDHIRQVPDVVTIAIGREKANALRYALKAGLIHTLIIDGTTASDVLGLDRLID